MAWRELYFYWRERHNDGRPPSRADIDPPLQIPRLLPNLMVIEVEPEAKNFRAKLIGSEIVRRAGRDTTGRRIGPDSTPARGLAAFVDFLQRVAETREPVIYSVSGSDQTPFGAIGLLLPLIGETNAVEMILGGLFYEMNHSRYISDVWEPGILTALSLPDLLDHPADLQVR